MLKKRVILGVCLFVSAGSRAQDPTVVAPNVYKVELENEYVRVFRVTYGPHAKTPMHDHSGLPAIIIPIKDGGMVKSIRSDGVVTEGRKEKVGEIRFLPARDPVKHQGENLTSETLEVIRIELKPQVKNP